MTARPIFESVDDDTADLLSLVADVEHTSHPAPEREWQTFLDALKAAADRGGLVDPNKLRRGVRGKVAPHRIGAFVNRARGEKLIVWDGDWVVSDDVEGRNSGKPSKAYRLRGTWWLS